MRNLYRRRIGYGWAKMWQCPVPGCPYVSDCQHCHNAHREHTHGTRR